MFDLQGTESENRIVADALARCDFPWDRLTDGLAAIGKTSIPVDWQDLSRYAADPDAQGASSLDATAATGAHDVRHHGDEYDVLEFRSRVLGLAWYSGRITIEQTLESDPDLAAEVFLSEVAHMADFFGMTDRDRVVIWNAAHPEEDHLPPDADIVDGVDLGHGHGWFDVGGYYSWVGEAWMGLFVRAFSDVDVSIGFDHLPTELAAEKIRGHFLPAEVPDPPTEGPGGPDSSNGSATVFGIGRSKVFHDEHGGIPRHVEWPSADAAVAAGRRPCKVCKPSVEAS